MSFSERFLRNCRSSIERIKSLASSLDSADDSELLMNLYVSFNGGENAIRGDDVIEGIVIDSQHLHRNRHLKDELEDMYEDALELKDALVTAGNNCPYKTINKLNDLLDCVHDMLKHARH